MQRVFESVFGLVCEKIESVPEHLHSHGARFGVVNFKVTAKENQIVDNKVGQPFELMGLVAVFELVELLDVVSEFLFIFGEIFYQTLLDIIVRILSVPDVVNLLLGA